MLPVKVYLLISIFRKIFRKKSKLNNQSTVTEGEKTLKRKRIAEREEKDH